MNLLNSFRVIALLHLFFVVNPGQAANTSDDLSFSFVIINGEEVCRSSYGGNCLHLAAMSGNTMVLSRVLNHRIDINARDARGATAVMWAANRGEMEVLKILISHRADLNCQDTQGGRTALMYAAPDRLDIVQYLLEQGANPNIKTHEGWTASEEALREAESNRRMPYREKYVEPNISKAKLLKKYEKKH